MEQVQISIPYSFIRQRAQLTWRDVRFGIEQGLLRGRDVAEVAADQMERGTQDDVVVELAGASPDEAVQERVQRLASAEQSEDPLDVRRKWAYLALAWIFEHRAHYPDVLDLVEKVYADLDYPEQVAPFVRYMPSDEPDLGSRERNEQRLISKWADYLRAESVRFAGTVSTPSLHLG
jgi:hypothetical protein